MPLRGDVACENCFLPHHEELRKWIRDKGAVGECPWCGAKNTQTVPLAELGDVFRPVAALYVEHDGHPDHEGVLDTVTEHIQAEWDVLSDAITEAPGNLAHDLMSSILEAGIRPDERVLYPDYRHSLFVTANFGATPRFVENWDERILELLHGSGVNSGNALTDERFQLALDSAERTVEKGSVFHRARRFGPRTRHEPFSPEEMGAPPPGTSAGRANRKEEAALYLASNRETALLEKRAFKHTILAVAEMVTKRPLRILDLTRQFYLRSPFFVEDLPWEVECGELLARFARDLSRPVLPEVEERHYIPSQEVCRILRENGIEGVKYPSEMGDGFNLVLFDPGAAEAMNVEHLTIRGVTLATRPVRTSYIRADHWPYGD